MQPTYESYEELWNKADAGDDLITVLAEADPKECVPDKSWTIAKYIVSVEEKLGKAREAMRQAVLAEEKTAKHEKKTTVERAGRRNTDRPLDTPGLCFGVVAAAFFDHDRSFASSVSDFARQLFDIAWSSYAPLAIGLCVRERFPVSPLETDLALRQWVSPRLVHLVRKLKEDRAASPVGSELLNFFRACINYDVSKDRASALQAADLQYVRETAVDKILADYSMGDVVVSHPERLINRLKELKAQVDAGKFRDSSGSKVRASITRREQAGEKRVLPEAKEAAAADARGPGKDGARFFAEALLKERLKSPEAIVLEMQRLSLIKRSVYQTNATVVCLDGKQRTLSEFQQYAPSPFFKAELKPWNARDKTADGKMLSDDGIWSPPKAFEGSSFRQPLSGPSPAAAGKGHSFATASRGDNDGPSASKRRLPKHPTEAWRAECKMGILAENAYTMANAFLIPDIADYKGNWGAQRWFEEFKVMFDAAELDNDMNPIGMMRTERKPYHGRRWFMSRIFKAVHLLESILIDMAVPFEDFEVHKGEVDKHPPERRGELFISTPSGRFFKRNHQMNMNRWLWGMSKATRAGPAVWHNCWLEMKLEERRAVQNHVYDLMSALKKVERLSLAPADQDGNGITKEIIGLDAELAMVNDFLAIIPARADNTHPIARSVSSANKPAMRKYQKRLNAVRGVTEALTVVMHERALTDLYDHYTPERLRKDLGLASTAWIRTGYHQSGIFHPLLWTRLPGKTGVSGNSTTENDMEGMTAQFHQIPFKMSMEHLRISLTPFMASMAHVALHYTRSAERLCRLAVDQFLADVSVLESGGKPKRVPWMSSYRFGHKTEAEDVKFTHPAHCATVAGLISEFITEKAHVSRDILDEIDQLILAANRDRQGRVNLSSVYSVIHRQSKNAELAPGIINEFYGLAEGLIELSRSHTARLFTGKDWIAESETSSHVLEGMCKLIGSVGDKWDILVNELAANLDELREHAVQEWRENRRAAITADVFFSEILSTVHNYSWHRMGQGGRHRSNVFSVMGSAVDLNRSPKIDALLYLATTAQWSMGGMIADNDEKMARFSKVGEVVRKMIQSAARSAFAVLDDD